MPLLQPPGARALWLLALVAMAVVSVREMRRGVMGLRPLTQSRDATSEALLASLTGERDVPRRLASELAKLPADRPILVLRPVSDLLSALPAYLVAYEALPRPVLVREARLDDTPSALGEMRRRFAAIVFVRQSPPATFPSGEAFGPSFVVVAL